MGNNPIEINNRNDFINFSRGFAILTIVIFHFLKHLPLPAVVLKAVNIGGGGVHLFVFASGFGLGLSKYSGFANFLQRRFKKVLIPYYIFITFIFISNIFLPLYEDKLPAYLSHIFLYKMFIEEYENSFGGQFWFVSTIIQFYLAFPLIRLIANKFEAIHALTIAGSISLFYILIITLLGLQEMRIWNSFFPQYLWEFMLGMLVAKKGNINSFINIPKLTLLLAMIVSYAIMAAMVSFMGTIGKSYNDVFSFFGYLSLAIISYQISLKILPLNKIINWVTTFSYSLFLTHYFVYDSFRKLLFKENLPLVAVPLILVLALFFAKGFDYFVNLLFLKKDSPIIAS